MSGSQSQTSDQRPPACEAVVGLLGDRYVRSECDDATVLVDADLIARGLTIVALIGATIEYSVIVRRRVQDRRVKADQLLAAETGLRGLVRVLLADRHGAP